MELFVLPISEAAALPDAYCAARFPDRFMRSRSMCTEADRLRCIGAGALIAHVMGIDESALVRGEHGKIDSASGATFAMLVIYCVRNISFVSGSHGLPELIAIAVTAGLHLWKRQTLLSIAGGTILYMVLVQFVFV